MTAVTVRRARADDLPAVAALRWESSIADVENPAAVDRDRFIIDLTRWAVDHTESNVCVVAELTGRIVGMAWLAISPRTPGPGGFNRHSGDLQTAYVVPECRNAGVGTMLVVEVLRIADELGLEHLTVHANERSSALYRRAGFDVDPLLLFRGRVRRGGNGR